MVNADAAPVVENGPAKNNMTEWHSCMIWQGGRDGRCEHCG